MVRMVDVGGELVATDPELISVVPRTGGRVEHARRLHAERCADYQEQERRERIADERRAFRKRTTGL